MTRTHGAQVWAGSDDGYVRQFVVSTGELVLRFRAHASRLYDVAFSPELNLLASCGQDQLLKLWRGDVEVDAARLTDYDATFEDEALCADLSNLASRAARETAGRPWSGREAS